MGVNINVYTFWGVKLKWDDQLWEAIEEYQMQHGDSEAPGHIMDGMTGEYMVLGVQLFDSGDFRYGELNEQLCEVHVQDLPVQEALYKSEFCNKLPAWSHVMDTPFQLIMFVHYH
jgi:hypothetical protein